MGAAAAKITITFNPKQLAFPVGCGHFLDNLLSGFSRIRGSGDGPADYQIIGAGADRLTRRRNARLVVRRSVCGTHSWNNNQELRPASGTNRLDFVRRCDHAIEARVFREARQCQSAAPGRARNADLPQSQRIHACENGHAKERGTLPHPFHRFTGGSHHGAPTQGMQREQPNIWQLGSRGNGSGRRVRDVVKLQVEKNVESKPRELVDRSRTLRCEKLTSNLNKAS